MRAATAGAWSAPNITNIAHAPVTSSAANTYRDVEQPRRAASAQVMPAKLMLNQERGQRAAGAAQAIDQQGTAPGSSTASTLEARFAAHVMCNYEYAPRRPDRFPTNLWVSSDDPHRQLKPLTSLEAEWKPAYVNQLVTELFKNHPLCWPPFLRVEQEAHEPRRAGSQQRKDTLTHFCLEQHAHRPTPGVAATLRYSSSCPVWRLGRPSGPARLLKD